MDVSDKPINLESLEMAKKRDKKVYITIRGSSYFAQPPFHTDVFNTRYTVFY